MAKFGYVGNQPDASSVIVARQIYTATGSVGVVTFNSGYIPGYLDVYLNGIRLVDAQDFSASDGSTIILTTDTISGDVIEMVAYKAFNLTASSVGVSSNTEVIRSSGVTDLNFVGSGFSFAVSGNTVDIYKNFVDEAGISSSLNVDATGTNLSLSGIITASGGYKIGIQSAGEDIATGVITALNFVGAGNTLVYNAGTKTVDISIQGGGGGGISSTGIATGAIFSNPSFISESFDLTDGTNNYGVFGPISIGIGATITVGAGNTFVVV